MSEFEVNIPEEDYSILQYMHKELPGIAVVNKALCGFEPKEMFPWHLSLIMDFEDIVEQGMPSRYELEVVDSFGDSLNTLIKGDPEMPNALFLARVTWNGTRQLVWRIYDPERANHTFQRITENPSPIRQFDYRMEHDPEWKFTRWHLENACP